MKTLHALIAAAFIAGSSVALAAEPEVIALNDAELDGLTAGANVLIAVNGTALASATSVGPLPVSGAVSATTTGTGATATVVETGPLTHIAGGGSFATATSTSAN